MPRPLEPLKDGEEFKIVTFKVSAIDYERICEEISRQKNETGYDVTLQDIMQGLIREGL